MSNEEAINAVYETLTQGEIAPEAYGYPFWETVKNALEKQIEKKPFNWNNEKHICPNCHRAEYIKKEPLNIYCGFCGQAIDWSETDD